MLQNRWFRATAAPQIGHKYMGDTFI